ncbi:fluoride efflux transporter CrcB [Streptomyces sp. NPDC059712]|uniref:fluoride efflux transporter CrcB n=1 Tax=Streptomyces sp. NPDC059712 TaxID=3346919 RepID=UPI00369F27FE
MTVPKTGGVGRVRPGAPGRPRWRAHTPPRGAGPRGGAPGAPARYAASLWWPTQAGGFPWTTLGVNVVGCAVIGVFMVVVTEVRSAHRLVRPFFGTGVLGGFTTFSTYAVDSRSLFADGRVPTGLAYLAATPLAALTAVWLAAWATRRVLKWRQT